MTDSNEVYIGLGSNLGDCAANIHKAVQAILGISGVEFIDRSHLYRTTPVGGNFSNDYVNAVCQIKTVLTPSQLYTELKRIEAEFGPRSSVRNSPRVMDLDILFYGTNKYSDHELEIPHPRWRERLFVLKPLSDLTAQVPLPNLAGGFTWFDILSFLTSFPNIHQETVIPIETNRKLA